ncbi:unnamed protein product [Microthlaspi erraticum]|uniref:DUF223 domain-containing protein n=1 Tax=Microthlaspi erraticum TaxID=1685480 RepID=A0A6D2LMP2_9BRAS|nr:unnamed protein product [Microthlaspi erraticum]
MAMEAAQPVSLCTEVKPFKIGWRIQVKILHLWKQYATTSRETIEMIFSDVEGNKIHGSVRKQDVKRYERYLDVGAWKFIQNFTVAHATGHYRTTPNPYKLAFIKETFVLPSANLGDGNYLVPVSFKQIHDAKVNESILHDIIGQVIAVGPMEEVDTQNKKQKKLEIELRDGSDDRIGCTLWGTMVVDMLAAAEGAGEGTLICLLRWAKVKAFQEVKTVSNAYSASVMLINPPYPEITSFANSIANDGLILSIAFNKPDTQLVVKKEQEEYWDLFPTSTISEVLALDTVGNAKIMCTVFAIDTDMRWYYIACPKYQHNKVKKVIPGLNQKVPPGSKQKWFCAKCNANITNVVARFKLHVKMMDSTRDTNLMLFDSLAKEIVQAEASELLGGVIDEIEDPDDLPEGLQALCGKTFQFVIAVDKANLGGGHCTYKVIKVLSILGMIDETEDLTDSARDVTPSELISGEPSVLMLEDSNEVLLEEGMLNEGTPISKKRNEIVADGSLDDLESGNKKACLREVKIEKIEKMKGMA